MHMFLDSKELHMGKMMYYHSANNWCLNNHSIPFIIILWTSLFYKTQTNRYLAMCLSVFFASLGIKKNNGHIAQFYFKDTENPMLLNMLLTLHSCD